MNFVISICLLIAGAGIITPPEDVTSLALSSPDKIGYIPEKGQALSFTAVGPAALIVKLRGPDKLLKSGPLGIKVIRDERYESAYKLPFIKRRVAPKGYPVGTEIGIQVPKGSHRYTIDAQEHSLVFILTTTKKIPKRLNRKVVETDLGEPQLVAAPPLPALEPLAKNLPKVDSSPAAQPKVVKKKPIEETRILIMDVAAAGVDPTIANQVTTVIAEAMQGREGMRAITSEELTSIAETETIKQSIGCDADNACLAEISSFVNADLVVNGTLGTVGDAMTLTLSLVDSKKASVTNRVSRVISKVEDAIDVTKELVQELFGWEGAGNKITYRIAEGKAVSFAVFDLSTAGLSENAARNLTQVLSVELKRIQGASVIGKDDIAAMLDLEGQKQVLGCDSDTSCLAEIGGALGVDKIVVGQVGKLADNFIISLRLISPTTARVNNRISENFVGTEATLIPAIRTAGRKLLGIESQEPGSLGVSSSESEAAVFLDGKEHGALPMPPINELKPGRYNLRVKKDGYFDWNGDVYVNPMDNTAMWIELQPRPAKWYQQWWVWTGVGVVAAGIATTLAITMQPEATTGSGTATINAGP